MRKLGSVFYIYEQPRNLFTILCFCFLFEEAVKAVLICKAGILLGITESV